MEIQVVAHCLLNPHTRVKGLGPLGFRPEPPLIQLPCPEALYLGLDRWVVTRNQLEVPEFRRFCGSLIVHYADIIQRREHKDCGCGRKSMLRSFYYQRRIPGRQSPGVTSPARHRHGSVHGRTYKGAREAGSGLRVSGIRK
ncbi:MAG: hypothetical protein ABR985_05270 [Methanotrichaceae archaeon]|jgi:hypothetical protein